MGINEVHLRKLVVVPTLKMLEPVIPYSRNAEELLMATAAHESQLGTFLKQVGEEVEPKGPALGIYQMEPRTHDDIHENYIKYNTGLKFALKAVTVGWPYPASDELVWNLGYATAMARIHYRRVREALPSARDVEAMARYWGKYYQTESDPDKMRAFVQDYKWLVVGGAE